MPVFFIILGLMLVTDVVWWWNADRLLRPMRRAVLLRTLLAAFMGLQLMLIAWVILSRSIGPGFDQLTPKFLISAVYVWHLLVLPLVLVAWIATGVITTPVRLTRWLRREKVEHPEHEVSTLEKARAAADIALEPETCLGSPSRRQFLGAAVAAAPPALLVGAVGYSAMTLDHFRVRDITVPIPNLPPDLEGFRVTHVTDVHVGRFTEGRQLKKIVEETNKLRADVILMTGDLLNSSIADLPASLDAVRRMDAKHGVFMCEGNHDLFDGVLQFRQRVRDAGVPLLAGESSFLPTGRNHPVQILGLPWGRTQMRRSGGGDDVLAVNVPQLMQQREPDAFPILLAHHPHAFDLAAEAGVPLTFAGHTHGGQLMLTENIGFGRMYRYWSGLYRKNNSSLVVSNGVGNWFPVRINAPAEIVHVTLKRA